MYHHHVRFPRRLWWRAKAILAGLIVLSALLGALIGSQFKAAQARQQVESLIDEIDHLQLQIMTYQSGPAGKMEV